jgi:predicted GIY-YIG superfamily endonuclease/ribosomal protein S18 acetylase RimI-like enzyme
MLKRKGFVYVLHFERPLCHSQHYIGCTCNLRERLITHATGRGARIVAAALDKGIPFKLGALGQCNVSVMYRLERQMKDWHGAALQCECCARDDARPIPGTLPYPIQQLPFATESEVLKNMTYRSWEEQVDFIGNVLEGMDGQEEWQVAFSRSIRELMQENKHALGFIPAGSEGGVTLAIQRNHVIVARVNGILAGYTLWTETEHTVNIHQCCVRDQFRQCGYGRRMLEVLKVARPGRLITAKVRDDLVANRFWQAVGFQCVARHTHDTSGSQLNEYQHVHLEVPSNAAV